MSKAEQTVLPLTRKENLLFVSEIDLDDDPNFSANFRDIYEAKAPIPGSINDTQQTRKIREIYKIEGVDTEDDDDEDEDQKVKAIAKPNYSAAQNSEKSPDELRQKKSGAPDYLSSGARDMSPVTSSRNPGYVCMPGSKGACNTCPVYSLMSNPGVAERLNQLRGNKQPGNKSYFTPDSSLMASIGS